jgi:hypothetical protein
LLEGCSIQTAPLGGQERSSSTANDRRTAAEGRRLARRTYYYKENAGSGNGERAANEEDAVQRVPVRE